MILEFLPDSRHVQGLVALRAVCQTCHNVMNFGRTSIIARQMADRYPTLMGDVTAHFMKVNGVDRSFLLTNTKLRPSRNGASVRPIRTGRSTMATTLPSSPRLKRCEHNGAARARNDELVGAYWSGR
jgi:hypothetical protein